MSDTIEQMLRQRLSELEAKFINAAEQLQQARDRIAELERSDLEIAYWINPLVSRARNQAGTIEQMFTKDHEYRARIAEQDAEIARLRASMPTNGRRAD